MENGSTDTAYFLSDIKRMSFSSGNITLIKRGGDSDTYAITDVRNLNFTVVTSVVQEPLPMKTIGTLHVFPNPVIDVLNIQLPSTLKSPGVLEILSLEGKLVYSHAINSSDDVYQINISGLSKGLYICKINNGLAIETAKFVKQ